MHCMDFEIDEDDIISDVFKVKSVNSNTGYWRLLLIDNIWSKVLLNHMKNIFVIIFCCHPPPHKKIPQQHI